MTFKIGHIQFNSGKTHWKKGVHVSIKTEFVKNDERITGEKHPNWKGDNVSNKALHRWVAKKIGNPHKCSFCGKIGRVELSNKNGLYNRNLENWQWICSKCHKEYDHIGEKVSKTRKANGTYKFYGNQYTRGVLC